MLKGRPFSPKEIPVPFKTKNFLFNLNFWCSLIPMFSLIHLSLKHAANFAMHIWSFAHNFRCWTGKLQFPGYLTYFNHFFIWKALSIDKSGILRILRIQARLIGLCFCLSLYMILMENRMWNVLVMHVQSQLWVHFWCIHLCCLSIILTFEYVVSHKRLIRYRTWSAGTFSQCRVKSFSVTSKGSTFKTSFASVQLTVLQQLLKDPVALVWRWIFFFSPGAQI